ncbi:recombination-associated protein RdgC [Billgrantia kenyensis]|uniref:Recombination-associated protein RdgC n=1 Tax=Billgrantia kenyensis TaxID=321266 RepID=A0A7W0ADD8_9GAMM|nr:recombination-associated protein RdgC [Halomonas kenyensis]MBA2778943.1 recombination-associated protein RdgC [Halomonas kenyensis]MCG6662870.1 recombination-associated protein RdgC [Halomonas kenyensis]
MWFKHLHLYRLHEAATIPAADLEEALAGQAARPPGSQEARRVGWCPPAGRAGTALLHELQGQRLLTMLRHERLLPAGVVREEVEERGAEIEAREGRKLRRQEKQEIKEQVYEELLPRAFVRSQKVDLWWDTRRHLIAVNTSSRKRAEEVLDLLRETLGSLKVTPLTSQTLPMRAMTQWLADESSRPAALQLGDQVELKAKGDDGVLRARQVDLDSDEIQQLLAAGKQASRLGIEVEGRLGYVLHDDLTLKSLRFSDALIDEAGEIEDDGDAVVRLEADFMLMTGALAEEVERLIDWLGGEANGALQASA